MAGAIQETLGLTEVYLRHAMDAQLRCARGAHGQWIANYDRVAHLQSIRDSRGLPYFNERKLKEDVRRNRKGYAQSHATSRRDINHDDLVAHSTFGAWTQLLPNRFDRNQTRNSSRDALWEKSLSVAFPEPIRTISRRSNPGESIGEYARIAVHLRNRANHVDSLLNIEIAEAFQNYITPLLSALGPEPVEIVNALDRVEGIWMERPCRINGPTYNLRAAIRY
ncbi:hypothetical protein JKI95_08475 [Corynebacterium aquatimens]|uniref:hypothetical protein n=1 Tax=Corynebacterium TaxID=1716 RepID=UPI001F20E1C6|nr:MULTISPECIES: hypothetical protein [Corynebacterium]QYH19232.1 hypothetical protein JKI95_08475 [Corynebacterium aquatimens]UIZ91880.1 hypothetical protein JZY91_09360 [Corynebacterium sp. CNCTC7651]